MVGSEINELDFWFWVWYAHFRFSRLPRIRIFILH